MRKFKRLTMTLALLIMAVTGAWAQTAFGVKEITADMLPASWSTDESAVTADDLAKLGFMEVTEAEAKTWTGAPQEGVVRLIYTLCESVNWVNGKGGTVSSYNSRKIFYSCLDGQKIFITTELTEWPLTSQDGKTWTLAEMPANDVELQVEYFAESNLFLSKDALADKTSIAVTAGELGVQFGEDGKSANTITEGTAMTVTYNGTKKVIGVKVEKKAAAPAEGKTYTNLKGGEVLHVGDKFTETEGKYRFTHDENPKSSDYYNFMQSSVTYEVLRANVVKDGYNYKYTESPDGQYYVLKYTYYDSDDEEWVTEYDFNQDLPVTGTSDGITVTLDGADDMGRKLYTFWVHEP